MTDPKPTDDMRPIPDGGLKDAMPAWLKRPPAWRALRGDHEQPALPPPDTSPIDPRTLVDVADLPQWLQSIAARESVSVATPPDSVDHAIKLLTHEPAPPPSEPAPFFKSEAERLEPIADVIETPLSDSHHASPISSPNNGLIVVLVAVPIILLIVLIVSIYLR